MRGILQSRADEAREIECTFVQEAAKGTARLCRSQFGVVCKALWPFKTAEHLAAQVGCSVRAAAYELSGEREPSARSILAVINEITPRRSDRRGAP